jgi:hypothetical protein
LFEDGRGRLLAFHGEHEAFGHLFGAVLAGFFALGLFDPFAYLVASGVAESGEPFREGLFGLEELCQFGGHGWFAFFEVGVDGDGEGMTYDGSSGFLHRFADEDEGAWLVRRGEERGAEALAADFDADAAADHLFPGGAGIEGQPDDDPAEAALEWHKWCGETHCIAGWHADSSRRIYTNSDGAKASICYPCLVRDSTTATRSLIGETCRKTST